ncbi:hypothetical protein C7434_1526 [Pantoea sp. PNA 14-12]|uniref:hypothetical protein n=1 Tax=Pantoea TaxID=53335 RepID=UPI00105DEADD|nr:MULTISPECIES: hypothetical protein [Pantoea]NRH22905.1 hypothetical protein [Pantoea stewartii]TDS72702.1 hypothetical protein C7434_1526 [Pantoea sp. PNA 14-12]
MEQSKPNGGRGRPRRTKIETPGADENTSQPTIQEQVSEIVASTTPAPHSETMAEQVAVEAEKGNVINMYHAAKPKIGDKWAGMVLNKHGWAAIDSEE